METCATPNPLPEAACRTGSWDTVGGTAAEGSDRAAMPADNDAVATGVLRQAVEPAQAQELAT
jgi:hypothetical protein